MTTDKAQLERRIGTLGATTIVMGSMLGIGIFLNPPVVARYSETLLGYLATWGFGGLVALCGALAFAELGASMPETGGEYAFLRRAWGPSIASAAGWTLVSVIFPGSIAAMSVAVAEFQLVPLLERVSEGAIVLERVGSRAIALGLVTAFTLINLLGARRSAATQTLLTLAPLFGFALLALVGFWMTPDPAFQPAEAAIEPQPWARSFANGFVATYFAYSGWNAVAYVAGEVKRPESTLPRALVFGTLAVTALYLLLAWFFVDTLGLAGVRAASEAGTASASAFLGSNAVLVMSSLIALGILSSINGTILGGARISFALAEDGLFPHAFRRVSSTTAVPSSALLLQAALCGGLIVTGTYEGLLALTSITMLVIGTAAVAAVFVLRRRAPELPRPFRIPFFPVPPLIYIVGSGVVIGYSCYEAIHRLFVGHEDAAQSWYALIGLLLFVVLASAEYLRARRVAGR